MAKKTPPPATPPNLSDYLSKIGRKGGKARLKSLTPEERSAIAKKAGQAGGRGRSKKALKGAPKTK
jgi:hypothetical protein